MAIPFADLLDLKPAGDSLWSGEADLDYSHPAGQFGGWTAATLLKAAMEEPGERGAPLTLTVLFTDAVGPGPFDVRTRLLRTGSRLQFWRAELAQRDKVCAHAQITFGQRRPASGFTDVEMFDLPPPDDPRMISFTAPARFGQLLPTRSLPRPEGFATGDHPARSIFWVRHAHDIAVDYPFLALVSDHTPPRPMIKTGKFIFSSTVSMNIYFHASPEEVASVGSEHLMSDTECRRSEGGYFDHHLRLWSPAGALLTTSEQLAAYRD